MNEDDEPAAAAAALSGGRSGGGGALDADEYMGIFDTCERDERRDDDESSLAAVDASVRCVTSSFVWDDAEVRRVVSSLVVCWVR